MVQRSDLPPRWGLLSFGEGGIGVVVRADWQECARTEHVASAIARTLTGDIYRADSRAMSSVNREIFAQQQQLAIQASAGLKPQIVLAPLPGEPEPPDAADRDLPPAHNPDVVQQEQTAPGRMRPVKRKAAGGLY